MNKLNFSSPKRIWVDLDETLCHTVKFLLEHQKITIWWFLAKEDDLDDYYLFRIPWISIQENEAIELFREIYRKDFENLLISPVLQADTKLKEFKNKWFENHIVTARDWTLFKDYTQNWIKKHFPDLISQIHFANHFWVHGKWIPKSEICKENWISIMIEDNHDYAMELARAEIKTFLLSKPWNFHKNENHENLVKVEHWWEIEID